jgi:hypothetical protein
MFSGNFCQSLEVMLAAMCMAENVLQMADKGTDNLQNYCVVAIIIITDIATDSEPHHGRDLRQTLS